MKLAHLQVKQDVEHHHRYTYTYSTILLESIQTLIGTLELLPHQSLTVQTFLDIVPIGKLLQVMQQRKIGC